MLFINRMLLVWALLAGVSFLSGSRLNAEEIPAVEIADLKASPQRYWAGFFVFKDVLEEKPGGSTLRIDKRKITRFRTRELGEVFAEEHLLPRLSKLKLNDEYLLVGTVSQKKSWLGSVFSGLLGSRGKFIVIVKDITTYRKNTAGVPKLMDLIEQVDTTNAYNQTLMVLEDIIETVNEDMFGYASAQNLTLAEAFARPESRDKLGASVRAALRKYEDRNRASSQELFIQIVMSFIAYQNGLVDLAKPDYEPEPLNPTKPVVLEDEPGPGVDSTETPESWDLSRNRTVSEPAPPPAVIEPAPVEPEAPVVEVPPDVVKEEKKEAPAPVQPAGTPENQEKEAIPEPVAPVEVSGTEPAPPPPPAVIEPVAVEPEAPVVEVPPDVVKEENKEAPAPVQPAGTPENQEQEAIPEPEPVAPVEVSGTEPPAETVSEDQDAVAKVVDRTTPEVSEDATENTRKVINFQESDLDGDGCITLEEFGRNSILDKWSEKRDVMAKAIFERIDADRDGCLTTREFGLIKYQKPIPVR